MRFTYHQTVGKELRRRGFKWLTTYPKKSTCKWCLRCWRIYVGKEATDICAKPGYRKVATVKSSDLPALRAKLDELGIYEVEG